jgi:hypothetical protein
MPVRIARPYQTAMLMEQRSVLSYDIQWLFVIKQKMVGVVWLGSCTIIVKFDFDDDVAI